MAGSASREASTTIHVDEKSITLHEQRASSQAAQRIERGIDLGFAARMDDLNLLAKLLRGIERIPHIPLGGEVDRLSCQPTQSDRRAPGRAKARPALPPVLQTARSRLWRCRRAGSSLRQGRSRLDLRR